MGLGDPVEDSLSSRIEHKIDRKTSRPFYVSFVAAGTRVVELDLCMA